MNGLPMAIRNRLPINDFVAAAVDHTADHVLHFKCYPAEHQTATGHVLNTEQLLQLLPPAFITLCEAYIHAEEG